MESLLGPSCSVFFSLLNETLIKKFDRKIDEKEAKYYLPGFLENWKN